MKMTLLSMVQDILNDMDSDEVGSINDTVESQQVAQIVKTCYYELIGNRNWPHLRNLIQLESVADVNKPNYLRIPENVKELESFMYDMRKSGEARLTYKDVKWKEPDDFMRLVLSRNSTDTNVKTVTDFSGAKLLIINDCPPTYWTSFDDTNIICDSYDAGIDSTLQQTKTNCVAYVSPTWTHTDAAVPNLPVEAFPALLEEAKSTAFVALKQTGNQKAEQKAGRQNRWLSRKAWRAHGGIPYENYGRKGRR